MLCIRQAEQRDKAAILRIMEAADLRYTSDKTDHFWVAEEHEQIIGIVRLEEFSDLFFLSSLGVAPEHQNKGIGTALLKELLTGRKKPVYLYTINPGFFQKLGFKVCEPLPQLPRKELFGCQYCEPGRCLCLVRQPQ